MRHMKCTERRNRDTRWRSSPVDSNCKDPGLGTRPIGAYTAAGRRPDLTPRPRALPVVFVDGLEFGDDALEAERRQQVTQDFVGIDMGLL